MKLKKILIFTCITGAVHAGPQQWKEECVGYYKIQVPVNLEVALYPLDGLLNTKRKPPYDGRDMGYFWPTITFGDYYGVGEQTDTSVQSQFSMFHYANYEISVSTNSKEAVDINKYKEKIEEILRVNYEARKVRLKEENPEMATPENKTGVKSTYKIKQYSDAFSIYQSKYFELHFNRANRLYIFRPDTVPLLANKTLTADEAAPIVEPTVQSLVKRFRPRELYEVPPEQGFCLPYGFIAGDSGQESHDMGVTYRLIDHPDVTIFFQDMGINEEIHSDEGSMKEAVTAMWNTHYLMGAGKKELLSPKWQKIEMDGREGIGTFVKATYNNVPTYDYNGHVAEYHNYIDYGYLAYIRGDINTRNKEPGLLLYISQDSSQVKDKPPMSKDELLEIATRITRSVTRR
ncbi:MAG: T6SS immunity protein Tli4 family protein [Morganella sp. (in: enterobacteria)]